MLLWERPSLAAADQSNELTRHRIAGGYLLGIQAMIWFVLAGGATILGGTVMYRRYVRRDPQAVHSRGGFMLFATFLFLFAGFALIAGIVAMESGR